MPARIKCLKCGRECFARVLEDDHTINSLVVEEDPDWGDEDQEEPTTCPHEEFDILEVTYDDEPY